MIFCLFFSPRIHIKFWKRPNTGYWNHLCECFMTLWIIFQWKVSIFLLDNSSYWDTSCASLWIRRYSDVNAQSSRMWMRIELRWQGEETHTKNWELKNDAFHNNLKIIIINNSPTHCVVQCYSCVDDWVPNRVIRTNPCWDSVAVITALTATNGLFSLLGIFPHLSLCAVSRPIWQRGGCRCQVLTPQPLSCWCCDSCTCCKPCMFRNISKIC